MTGVFIVVLTVAAFGLVGLWESNEKLRRQRDDALLDNMRLRARRNRLRRRLRRERAKHAVTEDALVVAGREAATHANHLEAVLEATRETPSLRLVRGQR